MAMEIVLVLFGAVLSVIGSMIANRLTKVADSVQQLRTEVTTLNVTVGAIKADLDLIKQNYVSKAEFAKEQADLKELHDAHWKLSDEHIRRCAKGDH